MRLAKTFLLAGTLMLGSILFVISCRRMDRLETQAPSIDIQKRFFDFPNGTNPLVIAINQKILRQEKQQPFVNEFIKWGGFPVWNKAQVGRQTSNSIGNSSRELASSGQYIYIPFETEDSSRIGAVLIAVISGRDTSLTMIYHWQYANFGFTPTRDSAWKAKNVFGLFTAFEYTVFGHTKFQIKDPRIIESSQADPFNVTLTNPEILNRSSYWSINCLDYMVCNIPSSGRSAVFPACYSYSVCSFYYDGGPDGVLPPSGGGGGGGGGPWNINPCKAAPGDNPCGGSGGWVPVLVDSSFDPYIADSVKVDTSLQNNFPCVQKIIDSLTQYSNVNALAQVALNTVFGVNEKIHLTLTANSAWGQGDIDGDTKQSGAMSIGSDFYATIRLNPWMLAHSSQEYIAATIIHEAVHAYIDYKNYQYLTGLIDSTTFQSMFPIYWPPKVMFQNNNLYYYAL